MNVFEYKKCLIVCMLIGISLFFIKYKRASYKPNIIIISLDTLRPDHMGCYGYQKNTTPSIDNFANNSVKFTQAYAPEPSTLPSHMSMFTSLYPLAHGIKRKGNKLSPKIPLLAEILKKNGYTTIGFVSFYYLSGKFGFSRGFDFYKQLYFGLTFAERININLLKLLKVIKKRHNMFIFLHYFDIHMDNKIYGNELPYFSPLEYRNKFIDKDLLNKGIKLNVNANPATNYLSYYSYETKNMPPEEEIEYLRGLYDAGINYTDYHINELFDILKKLKIYDNSLIILTSDHGVEFGEHGKFIHNQVYEENIKIPLLIKFPENNFAGSEISELVENIDIMPTVLEYLKIDPPKLIQGKSMLYLLNNKLEHRSSKYIHAAQKIGNNIFALRSDKYKIIYNTSTMYVELYDLFKDNFEKKNIYSENIPKAIEIKQNLINLIKQNLIIKENFLSGKNESEEDKETLEQLKSLGYAQ